MASGLRLGPQVKDAPFNPQVRGPQVAPSPHYRVRPRVLLAALHADRRAGDKHLTNNSIGLFTLSNSPAMAPRASAGGGQDAHVRARRHPHLPPPARPPPPSCPRRAPVASARPARHQVAALMRHFIMVNTLHIPRENRCAPPCSSTCCRPRARSSASPRADGGWNGCAPASPPPPASRCSRSSPPRTTPSPAPTPRPRPRRGGVRQLDGGDATATLRPRASWGGQATRTAPTRASCSSSCHARGDLRRDDRQALPAGEVAELRPASELATSVPGVR